MWHNCRLRTCKAHMHQQIVYNGEVVTRFSQRIAIIFVHHDHHRIRLSKDNQLIPQNSHESSCGDSRQGAGKAFSFLSIYYLYKDECRSSMLHPDNGIGDYSKRHIAQAQNSNESSIHTFYSRIMFTTVDKYMVSPEQIAQYHISHRWV